MSNAKFIKIGDIWFNIDNIKKVEIALDSEGEEYLRIDCVDGSFYNLYGMEGEQFQAALDLISFYA